MVNLIRRISVCVVMFLGISTAIYVVNVTGTE